MNIHKVARAVKKNSDTILTVLGAAGTVVGIFTAVKATPKALRLIKDAEDDKGEKLTAMQVVSIAAKEYVPTALICAGSLTCIFGANIISKRTQASLSSAYALINESYQNYRKSLIELHGKEADIEVRDHMILSRSNSDYHQIDIDAPDQKVIFVEEYTNQRRVAYEREIMDAEYHLNRNYTLRGYVTLQEYLHFLGFDDVDGSEEVGWSSFNGEVFWIDFYHRAIIEDGKEIYVISTEYPPTIEDLEDCL